MTLVLVGALVLAIGAATAFIATGALDQDVDHALEQIGDRRVATAGGRAANDRR